MAQVRTPSGAIVDDITGQLIQAPSSISASDLTTNQQSFTPVQPETPSVTFPTLEQPTSPKPLQPTTQETELSDLIKTITTERTTLPSERATFQAEEEKRLGLEKLQTEEADLFSQLKQQEAEFKNLEAEDQRIKERVLLESEGRGRTEAGVAPLIAGELRKNFLRKSEAAAQANMTAALLAGTQGKLVTAQSLVDRAVQNKFGARESILNAKISNLELLSKDPTLTLAQQNRANAQLKAQTKEQESLTKKKEDAKTILGWATTARQNGASALEAQQIATIGLSDNPNMQKAFELATPFLQKKETGITSSIQEYEFAKSQGYAGTFSEYQNEDANRQAIIQRAGQQGLPYQVINQIDKLSASFDSSPIVKNYNEVQNKKLSIDSILNTGIRGPADLAIVFEFMKALDPNSVVRESEYESASKSGNIFAGAFARFNGYLKAGGGFLPEKVRKDFQNIINEKFKVVTQQYDNLRNETARKINIKTGTTDGADYLTDYSSAINTPKTGNLNINSLPPTDEESIGDNVGFFKGLLKLFK